jgi:hypothetical protein
MREDGPLVGPFDHLHRSACEEAGEFSLRSGPQWFRPSSMLERWIDDVRYMISRENIAGMLAEKGRKSSPKFKPRFQQIKRVIRGVI